MGALFCSGIFSINDQPFMIDSISVLVGFVRMQFFLLLLFRSAL